MFSYVFIRKVAISCELDSCEIYTNDLGDLLKIKIHLKLLFACINIYIIFLYTAYCINNNDICIPTISISLLLMQ